LRCGGKAGAAQSWMLRCVGIAVLRCGGKASGAMWRCGELLVRRQAGAAEKLVLRCGENCGGRIWRSRLQGRVKLEGGEAAECRYTGVVSEARAAPGNTGVVLEVGRKDGRSWGGRARREVGALGEAAGKAKGPMRAGRNCLTRHLQNKIRHTFGAIVETAVNSRFRWHRVHARGRVSLP
jgi:hypothetical protein